MAHDIKRSNERILQLTRENLKNGTISWREASEMFNWVRAEQEREQQLEIELQTEVEEQTLIEQPAEDKEFEDK